MINFMYFEGHYGCLVINEEDVRVKVGNVEKLLHDPWK